MQTYPWQAMAPYAVQCIYYIFIYSGNNVNLLHITLGFPRTAEYDTIDNRKKGGVSVDKVYLTTEEAAELLRMHVRTVQRLIRDGEIGAFKVGGRWKIPAEEIKALEKKNFNRKEYYQ